jgi:homoserine O-acetyltransferase
MQHYHVVKDFLLENGTTLKEVTIAYHTYGSLNEARNNVIWVCHALTANADVQDWWPGMVGENKLFDSSQYFVVCANILGSCYGTTGPTSSNPSTNSAYYDTFPLITIRDMVNAHRLLCNYLRVSSIELLVGGSMGGYQALEWSVMEPNPIKHLFLLATSARESPWGIAIHTAQRMAIETDATWRTKSPEAGKQGLKTARAIGMLTYRSYEAYEKTQAETDYEKVDEFRASSYIMYQGNKLANRFTAYSYWYLTKAMDTHNIARQRGTLEETLQSVKAKALVLGITSDLLCPVQEQNFLAEHIPHATFVSIPSAFGHDGFLLETEAITKALSEWWKTK